MANRRPAAHARTTYWFKLIALALSLLPIFCAACAHAAVTPQTGLWIVDAENNSNNGRGFQIEEHGGTLVMTYYGYLADGSDHWYLSAGSYSNDSFSGAMEQYLNGTALGGTYAAAGDDGSVGNVTFSFDSSTTGTVTFPGEAPKAIEKFAFSGSSTSGFDPENGLWIINSENNGNNGRGFQIEEHGGTLVFTYYGYDATGKEVWYLATGTLVPMFSSINGGVFTADLIPYTSGPVLGGSLTPAVAGTSPGQVTLDFDSATTGSIQLPGEAAVAMSKFEWGATSQTASSLTYPIVDTGQVDFYDNTGTLSAAPASSSDAFYGEDAQFSGLQPAYRDNGDGTVSDLNTGLMWVKARGSKVSWADAVSGAANCTVGGYTDWRMPTVKELYSLIEFTGNLGSTDATSIPYIDTNYFDITFGDTDPNESNTIVGNRVIDGQDWTATRYVSTTMDGDETVFGVNFIDGRIKGYPVYDKATGAPNTKYVRYVRGNTSYGQNDFVDNGDGTVTDRATGLMWAQNDSGKAMDWLDALAWVQQQNAANYLGHSDWRLPNAKELQSIVDYSRSPDTSGSPAIDPIFNSTAITNEEGARDFPWYWSGTTHVEKDTSNEAVYVAFGRALGWMELNGATCYSLYDVHGAGAQRTDPKSGSLSSYLLGQDCSGNDIHGRGPQGDVVRITNYVRLVRDAN